MALQYPPTRNGLQKTLDAQLDQGTTASMTLNNVTGVQNQPGVVVINRIDTNGAEKSASLREYVLFTGTSGNTLTGLTRGLSSSTDQDHAVGSVVEFIFDVTTAQAIIDALLETVDADGALDSTKITAGVDAASDSAAGKVELATTGETETGTDATRAVTPDGLHDMTTLAGAAWFLDEDDLVSDSAVKVPSQQSVKAYVDASGSSSTDGWTTSSDTWTYASASTFTIAGVDRTSVFTKGTRLKFNQSGVKYAVVVNSSFATNTTVTIAVNTDFTIANAAISDTFYSYESSPAGYPTWFNFSPTWTGFSANPSSGIVRYAIFGTTVHYIVALGTDGTSNATTLTVTAPTASESITYHMAMVKDNGTWQSNPGRVSLAAGSATVSVFKDLAGSAFTNTGNKNAIFQITYQMD